MASPWMMSPQMPRQMGFLAPQPAPAPMLTMGQPAAAAPNPIAPPPASGDIFSMLNPGSAFQVSPAEQAAIKAEKTKVRTLMDQAMLRRRGNIASMKESLLNMQQEKPGIDWSPAFGLADMLNKGTGAETNMQAMYLQSGLRPESKQSRQNRLLNMQKTIDKAEQGALDAEVRVAKESLRSLQAGAYGKAASQQAKQEGINQRFMTSQFLKNFREDRKILTKVSDEAMGSKNDLVFVEDALRDGSVQRVQQALSKMARLAGEKGALAESDVARQMMPTIQGQLAKMEAQLKLDPNAKADPDAIKHAQNAMATMRQAAADMFSGRIDNPLRS